MDADRTARGRTTAPPADPRGLDDLVTHVRPLAEAPDVDAACQEKADHVVKVVLTP